MCMQHRLSVLCCMPQCKRPWCNARSVRTKYENAARELVFLYEMLAYVEGCNTILRGGDYPLRRAALSIHQPRVSPPCQQRCSQSRRRLKFYQPGAVSRQYPSNSFDGGAYLGHRRVHSHPSCVAAFLQVRSSNLHRVQRNLSRKPRRRRVRMIGNYLVPLPKQLGSIVLWHGSVCHVPILSGVQPCVNDLSFHASKCFLVASRCCAR